MMKPMAVRAMLFIASITVSGGVSAKDIVVGGAFECESTQAMRIEPVQERYEQESKQKFTVLIDEASIRFLSKVGGYLNEVSMQKQYHQDHLLSAYASNGAFSLERTQNRKRFRFHYVDAMFSRSFVMFGYCSGY